MGVDRSDYMIIGYKLPYNQKLLSGLNLHDEVWEDEQLIPMVEGHKGEPFTIVTDGMSGKYIAFGKALATADKYDGFNFVEIDLSNIDFSDVKQRGHELFGDIGEPKILLFTHYS